ncbi:early nodulin-like protein 7 [Gastrolobium bilobum]|uniref:early nodulin-like protein 7 n=1 Tax=Gastrolobium bilobum TaxID=150636 RepID=UPI002AB06CD3|nr:early nodulin-like protein 7 [Gastrolobium bilobum]
MASSLLGLVLCTCLIIFFAATNTSVEAAMQFKVGGHLGWHEPGPNNTEFYIQWAEMNRFQIGDSLVFEYQNDSVLTVEKMDYFNCDSSDPITAFDNGKSTLNLDRPGAFYFISGTDDHCNNGQKLLVEVMHPHPIPKFPPSISLPPEGFSPVASSPSYTIEVSASMVLSPIFMCPLASLASVMMLLAP